MKSIAVFCGSSYGASEQYVEKAKQFGVILTKQDIKLIYGGASVGLMGVIADSVLKNGGQVTGVMPHFLERREIAHPNLTDLIIVDSMHERKAKMAKLAEGFVALPGGSGTLEEFFEMFTWSQLRLHDKPCALLNINEYFNPLLTLFNHMINENFLHEKFKQSLIIDEDPHVLIDKMNTFLPPEVKTFD